MSWRDKIAKAALDKWFGKSVVTTREGTPQIVYRGEHGTPKPDELFRSRHPSLAFGNEEVANLYAMEPNGDAVAKAPRVIPGYLKIEKPAFNLDDPFLGMDAVQRVLGRDEAERIANKFGDRITGSGRWYQDYRHDYNSVRELLKDKPKELDQLYFDAYHYLDDPREIAQLKKRGFDGALMEDIATGSREYRIFDPKTQFWPGIPRIYSAGGVLGGMGGTFAADQYGAQQ